MKNTIKQARIRGACVVIECFALCGVLAGTGCGDRDKNDDEVNKLSREVAEERQKSEALLAENQRFNNSVVPELENLRATIHASEATIVELDAALKKKNDLLTALLNEIEEKKEQARLLQERIEESRVSLDSLQQTLSESEVRLEQTRSELLQTETRMEELEAEIARLRLTSSADSDAIAALEREKAELEQQRLNLEEQVTVQSSENESLRLSLSTADTEITNLKKELVSAQLEIAALAGNDALSSLQSEVQTLTAELGIVRADLGEKERLLLGQTEEIALQNAELQRLAGIGTQLEATRRIGTDTLRPFSGLSYQKAGEVDGFPCSLFVRVDSELLQIVRVISCAENQFQVDVLPISRFDTGASAFSEQVLKVDLDTSTAVSSCGSDQRSFAPLSTSISFCYNAPLNGVGSREPCLSAAMSVGALTMLPVRTGYLGEFRHVSQCDRIRQQAARYPEDAQLKVALQVCELTPTDSVAGCYLSNSEFVTRQ